jgi:hypothetical protein
MRAAMYKDFHPFNSYLKHQSNPRCEKWKTYHDFSDCLCNETVYWHQERMENLTSQSSFHLVPTVLVGIAVYLHRRCLTNIASKLKCALSFIVSHLLECVNGLWHSCIFDLIWSSMICDHWSSLISLHLVLCSRYGYSLVPDMDVPLFQIWMFPCS